MNRQLPGAAARAATALSIGLLAFALVDVTTSAQDRLKTMPGYAQYQKVSAQLNGLVRSGAINGTWSADSTSVEYVLDGKRYSFDVAARSATELGAAADGPAVAGRGGRGGGRGGTGVERGRQAASVDAPDGRLKAFYRDRNLWVSDAAGGNESAITTDGNDKDRIKYGTASWVYGEELGQTSAMWWSPDSRKVAYYRFDEKQVLDYYLQLDQTKIQSTNDVEAYPKAGARIRSSTSASTTSRRRRVRRSTSATASRSTTASSGITSTACPGRPTAASCCSTAPTAGRTSSSSSPRTPTPARPASSSAKSGRPAGSTTGRRCSFLKDNRRFIWESERNGFANFYLYDLSGTLITPLTSHTTFEVTGLSSRSTKRPASCSTRRATATTT